MAIEKTTDNRGYQLPHPKNLTRDDVYRLIHALRQIDADVASILSNITEYLKQDSPSLFGTPTAPTPPAGNSSNRIATTDFVLNNIPAGVRIFKGGWDASTGRFPLGRRAGWEYEVTVGGRVDGVEFSVGDAIIAEVDNASRLSYRGNWRKRDFTDVVRSVAGKTGAVKLALADIIGAGTAAALDEATKDQFLSNTPDKLLSTDQVWRAAGVEYRYQLGGTIGMDMSRFINAAIFLRSNARLANPRNPKVGQSGRLRVVQDAVGGRTLSFGSHYMFDSLGAPSLTGTANAEDILYYDVIAPARIEIYTQFDRGN